MNKFNFRNPYIFKKIHFFKHIFNKHCKYKSKINNNKVKNCDICYSSLIFYEKNINFYNSLILNVNKINKKLLVTNSKKY